MFALTLRCHAHQLAAMLYRPLFLQSWSTFEIYRDEASRKCEAWASIFVEMIAQASHCTLKLRSCFLSEVLASRLKTTTVFLSSFCRMRSIHAFLLLSFSKEGRKMRIFNIKINFKKQKNYSNNRLTQNKQISQNEKQICN